MTENTLAKRKRTNQRGNPNDREYIDRMTENTLAEWQRIHWPNDREYIGRMTENTLAEWQRIHWPNDREYIGQKKKDKQEPTKHYKETYRATRTSLKSWVRLDVFTCSPYYGTTMNNVKFW